MKAVWKLVKWPWAQSQHFQVKCDLRLLKMGCFAELQKVLNGERREEARKRNVSCEETGWNTKSCNTYALLSMKCSMDPRVFWLSTVHLRDTEMPWSAHSTNVAFNTLPPRPRRGLLINPDAFLASGGNARTGHVLDIKCNQRVRFLWVIQEIERKADPGWWIAEPFSCLSAYKEPG